MLSTFNFLYSSLTNVFWNTSAYTYDLYKTLITNTPTAYTAGHCRLLQQPRTIQFSIHKIQGKQLHERVLSLAPRGANNIIHSLTASRSCAPCRNCLSFAACTPATIAPSGSQRWWVAAGGTRLASIAAIAEGLVEGAPRGLQFGGWGTFDFVSVVRSTPCFARSSTCDLIQV